MVASALRDLTDPSMGGIGSTARPTYVTEECRQQYRFTFAESGSNSLSDLMSTVWRRSRESAVAREFEAHKRLQTGGMACAYSRSYVRSVASYA